MLRRKMMHDLKMNFGQFLAIALLTFVAMTFFSGTASEVIGVINARENFESEANLADGWIYGNDIDEADVGKIAEISGVDSAEGRRYEEAETPDSSLVFTYFVGKNDISRTLVLDGKPYDADDAQSVWLSKRFAEEQGIKIGDNYELLIDGKAHDLKVAGLIWHPEYEYYKNEVDLEPDYTSTGYAFASIKALDEDERVFNQIVIKSGVDKISSLEGDVAGVLGDRYSVLLDRSGITNLTVLDDEIAQHKMMAIMFPAFFAIISVLTVITTMSRIVDKQRTQIGTMKAIGVKERKIYLHYLGYGFYPSLIGSLVGVIVGPQLLAPTLFKMKYYLDSSDEYMLPHFDVKIPPYFVLLALVMVAACTLATWLSCKRILEIRPALALRPAQPKSGRKTIFEKMPFWQDLRFSARYNLRDVSRNKARTIFGIAGTVSCMALLLCAFSSKDDFKGAVTELYAKRLMNDSSMITLEKDIPIAEAESIRDEVDGELVMSDTVEIRKPETDDKYSYHMNVYEDGKIANVLDTSWKTEKITGNDFTLTKKAADTLGVSAGDTVEWHIYGSSGWKKSKVTAITRAPFEQGIVATRGAIEEVGYAFTPTRLLTQKTVDASLKDKSTYIADVTSKEELAQMLSAYMKLADMVMGFMLLFAVFLAVIVLYSLGVLSFEERKKELATLKVLGFSTKKLRKLMLEQNVIVTIIGTILGIPLGKAMLNALINSLGESMDVPTNCRVLYIVVSFVITFAISAIVNGMFSGRLKNLDMVEEIKTAE